MEADRGLNFTVYAVALFIAYHLSTAEFVSIVLTVNPKGVSQLAIARPYTVNSLMEYLFRELPAVQKTLTNFPKAFKL